MSSCWREASQSVTSPTLPLARSATRTGKQTIHPASRPGPKLMALDDNEILISNLENRSSFGSCKKVANTKLSFGPVEKEIWHHGDLGTKRIDLGHPFRRVK